MKWLDPFNIVFFGRYAYLGTLHSRVYETNTYYLLGMVPLSEDDYFVVKIHSNSIR